MLLNLLTLSCLRQEKIYPKPPLNPKILEQTEDSLTMGWDNKGNYNIYLDGNKIDTIKNTFYTFTGLDPNKEYQLCVAPVSSMGEGEKVCLTGKTKVKIEEVVVIPKRVDIDTGETQQMTIQTLPPEALEQYSYKIEPVLDGSIIEVEGDKVKGLKEVNDSRVGENLLNGTIDFSGNWTGKNYWIASDKFNHFSCLKRNQAWNGVGQEIYVEKDTELTFSFNYKCENNDDEVFIYIQTVEKGGEVDVWRKKLEVRNEWTRASHTFKVTKSGIIKPRVEITVGNSYLHICGFKLEKGSSPTPWTPSPLDNYSYTNAKVVFNDKAKSEKEFEVFVHKPKTQESLTEPEIVNNTL